jgi:hypothetical protein
MVRTSSLKHWATNKHEWTRIASVSSGTIIVAPWCPEVPTSLKPLSSRNRKTLRKWADRLSEATRWLTIVRDARRRLRLRRALLPGDLWVFVRGRRARRDDILAAGGDSPCHADDALFRLLSREHQQLFYTRLYTRPGAASFSSGTEFWINFICTATKGCSTCGAAEAQY